LGKKRRLNVKDQGKKKSLCPSENSKNEERGVFGGKWKKAKKAKKTKRKKH